MRIPRRNRPPKTAERPALPFWMPALFCSRSFNRGVSISTRRVSAPRPPGGTESCGRTPAAQLQPKTVRFLHQDPTTNSPIHSKDLNHSPNVIVESAQMIGLPGRHIQRTRTEKLYHIERETPVNSAFSNRKRLAETIPTCRLTSPVSPRRPPARSSPEYFGRHPPTCDVSSAPASADASSPTLRRCGVGQREPTWLVR